LHQTGLDDALSRPETFPAELDTGTATVLPRSVTALRTVVRVTAPAQRCRGAGRVGGPLACPDWTMPLGGRGYAVGKTRRHRVLPAAGRSVLSTGWPDPWARSSARPSRRRIALPGRQSGPSSGRRRSPARWGQWAPAAWSRAMVSG
jgi:hypothetical protein